MEILGLETVTDRTRICDKHFTNKDYGLNLSLTRTSAPSLYLDIVLENPVELKSETAFEAYEIQDVFVKQEVTDYQNQNEPCRICLKKEDSMIWLFDLHEMEETVAGLYRYCTGLEVAENDKFPQYICKVCFCKLGEACKIKKTSIESHFILKNQLEEAKEQDNLVVEEDPIAKKPKEKRKRKKQKNSLEGIDEVSKKHLKRSYKRKPLVNEFKPFFYCDTCECDVYSRKRYHLNEHRKSGIKPIEVCKSCEKTFYLKVDFSRHICEQLVTECNQCNLKFYFAREFKEHLKEVHIENEMYTCPEADCTVKKLQGVENAYYHIRWHKYKIEHMCETCGMKFESQLKFIKHRINHGKPKLTYTCDLCGTKIANKTNLGRHMKQVHHKLKVDCEICQKSFSDNMYLRLHKMRDHGENLPEAPFKCETCNQVFLFQSQLKIHKNISHKTRVRARRGERPTSWTCEICNKVFIHQANLYRHRQTVHEKIRNYVCQYCAKSFSQKTQVETHTRIHTGEKPFQCQYCDSRYSDRSTLSKHLKSQHKESGKTTKTASEIPN